ncbi:gag-pol fusion protein [Pseudohyphozyma bogoriensis]|nr:gag-pol fusion protein [Pseudohyphozyma bogoriensis]
MAAVDTPPPLVPVPPILRRMSTDISVVGGSPVAGGSRRASLIKQSMRLRPASPTTGRKKKAPTHAAGSVGVTSEIKVEVVDLADVWRSPEAQMMRRQRSDDSISSHGLLDLEAFMEETLRSEAARSPVFNNFLPFPSRGPSPRGTSPVRSSSDAHESQFTISHAATTISRAGPMRRLSLLTPGALNVSRWGDSSKPSNKENSAHSVSAAPPSPRPNSPLPPIHPSPTGEPPEPLGDGTEHILNLLHSDPYPEPRGSSKRRRSSLTAGLARIFQRRASAAAVTLGPTTGEEDEVAVPPLPDAEVMFWLKGIPRNEDGATPPPEEGDVQDGEDGHDGEEDRIDPQALAALEELLVPQSRAEADKGSRGPETGNSEDLEGAQEISDFSNEPSLSSSTSSPSSADSLPPVVVKDSPPELGSTKIRQPVPPLMTQVDEVGTAL